jgi:hypothetical protein
MDVEEMLAAVGEVQQAGGEIQRVSERRSATDVTQTAPSTVSEQSVEDSSIDSSVRSSSVKSAKKSASEKKGTGGGKKKKATSSGISGKKAGTKEAANKPTTSQTPSDAKAVKALRRRAEDAEAVAAQAGRALERVSELKAVGRTAAPVRGASDSAGDKRALHCEVAPNFSPFSTPLPTQSTLSARHNEKLMCL